MEWTARVRAAFPDERRPEDDVVEELAQHAADAYAAEGALGRSHQEALEAVDRQIREWAVDPAALQRRIRRRPAPAPPPVSAPLFAGVLHDARYALRVLRRQPGYTAAAVATMGLGIGAATIIFTVLYGVLLKPLPWSGADRLVRLSESRQGGTNRLGAIFTNAAYRAWADHPTTLESLGAWAGNPATLTGAGDPVRIQATEVTASLLSILGARAEIGALFTEADEARSGVPPIILSHGLWRERLGGSPAALGRTVRLDDRDYRVAAVMPPSFAFPDRETRAWIPLHVPPVTKGSLSMFRALGRLRPGVTPAQAAAEGTARARHGDDIGLVGVAVFGSKGLTDIGVVPYLESLTKEVRPAILVFFAAVTLLLATATANVASLQLARATGRRRELAIRTAIGADTRQLLRQFLVENGLVGLAGGAAGLALTWAVLRALPTLLPAGFPRLDEISLNLPVLSVTLAASLATGIVFGILPVWQIRGLNLTESLSEDSLAPVGAGSRTRTARARTVIMAGQVAIACVLLLGALLLARSFRALWMADRGYDPQNVLTASIPLPDAAYTGERRVALLSSLLDRLRAVPGVRAAAATTTLPLTPGEMVGSLRIPSRRGDGMVDAHAAFRQVSTGYFAAMGIRVADGRPFSDADTKTSPPVVIVNRSFARQYLAEPPVGQHLPVGSGNQAQAEVIGVVDDVRHRGVTDAEVPELYVPYTQLKDGVQFDEPKVVVRTTAAPALLVPVVRGILRELDPSAALDDVRTMEDRVSRSLAQPRLNALLLGAFAGFAVVIAAVGLFGVLSYTVAQRTREIGVRSALGARPLDIVGLVVRQGLAMAAVGTILGIGVSFAVLKYLSTLLYGVTAYDAPSYAGVAVGLLAIAAIACAIPARRAARVDPLRALRT
jgi:putative ABC transport system permease protein